MPNTDILMVNIPDDAANLDAGDLAGSATGGNLDVTMGIRLHEHDKNNGDDLIDMNPGSSRDFAGESVVVKIPLGCDSAGTLQTDSSLVAAINAGRYSDIEPKAAKAFQFASGTTKRHYGNDDSSDKTDGYLDGEITTPVGDNVPRSFLKQVALYHMGGSDAAKVPTGLRYG